jgi:hypothetical protein
MDQSIGIRSDFKHPVLLLHSTVAAVGATGGLTGCDVRLPQKPAGRPSVIAFWTACSRASGADIWALVRWFSVCFCLRSGDGTRLA